MKHILKQFTQREAHPFIQFIKYGIAGGAATLVDMVICFILAWKVFPALKEDELLVRLFGMVVPALDETLRARNFIFCSAIAFIFSNLTAYMLNFHWVFHPGRHKRHVEISLFLIVSLVSIFIGTWLGQAMIRYWGLGGVLSYGGKLIAALMINFVCRKYIVFKG